MNLTPLQHLINRLTEVRKIYEETDVEYRVYSNIIDAAKSLLMTEKRHIIHAFTSGQHHIIDGLPLKLTSGLHYYNKKYKAES